METRKRNISEQGLQTEVQVIYNEIIKSPEVSEALNLLDSIPNNLVFHNKNHTLDVIKETILFALADGADKKAVKQQSISAAWHDIGFLDQYEKNEPIAVEKFNSSEASNLISQNERDEVVANILDTQMVMVDGHPSFIKQRSRLGYVLDADVSNFGREDFFEKSLKIAEEFKIDLSDEEQKKSYYKHLLDLLKNHEWKTISAKILRQAQKEINIKKLEKEYI